MTPEQRLKRDTEAVLALHRELLDCTGGVTDKSRLLIVMSITHGAERHLPRSLPRLLDQMRTMGRSVDLLIGCNNGFESQLLIDYLAKSTSCHVIHGYSTKSAPNEPAPVVNQKGEPLLIGAGETGENRCFLVHQRCSPEARTDAAAGKIRMLGDLYGLIGQSIKAGWRPPHLLLACDAESEFDLTASWSGAGAGEPALSIMVNRLEADPTLHFVGARNRLMVFETDDEGGRHPPAGTTGAADSALSQSRPCTFAGISVAAWRWHAWPFRGDDGDPFNDCGVLSGGAQRRHDDDRHCACCKVWRGL